MNLKWSTIVKISKLSLGNMSIDPLNLLRAIHHCPPTVWKITVYPPKPPFSECSPGYPCLFSDGVARGQIFGVSEILFLVYPQSDRRTIEICEALFEQILRLRWYKRKRFLSWYREHNFCKGKSFPFPLCIMYGSLVMCNIQRVVVNLSLVSADIDECSHPDSCSQLCNNTEGSFICSCVPGYKLKTSGYCRALGKPLRG